MLIIICQRPKINCSNMEGLTELTECLLHILLSHCTSTAEHNTICLFIFECCKHFSSSHCVCRSSKTESNYTSV